MTSDKPVDGEDDPGDLSRFSGTAEGVAPLGVVIRRTSSDPEGEKAMKEANRLIEKARRGE